MAGLPWYAHHIERYERKTVGLTMQQDGAYRRLLDYYYKNESPLPAVLPAVYRIAGAMKRGEQKDVTFILNAYFVLENDGWHNKTADEEILKARSIIDGKSSAGKVGAEARWTNKRNASANDKRMADASQTQRQNDATLNLNTNQEISSKSLSRALRDEFEKQFWPVCCRKVGKAPAFKAFVKARKAVELPVLVTAMKRYAISRAGQDDQYTAHPSTWLSKERWNDEIAPITAASVSGDSIEEIIAKARALDEKPLDVSTH